MMGVIVSVNVGLPQNVAWQGRTVRTGVWKTPVTGRIFARRLNLDGDGQGDLHGHGGEQRALLVYQLDSYRYWAKYLGRSDLVAGNFGENLTVEGLADSEVCIGDRFRIGGAIVEVSQPRDTCYRVGIRLNHPGIAALLVAHHRPGFYFRVIQEGEIGAGDRVEKLSDGPERMTIVEIDALLYSAEHTLEGLRRAVRIPALSLDWQGSMQALLTAAEAGGTTGNAGLGLGASAPLAWRGFRPVMVVASREESADVRSFEFAAEDGSPLPPARPGQYIMVRMRPSPDAPAVTRSYSLCGPPGNQTYRIGVKNEHGLASGFLHRRVRAGSRLEISAPRGSFTLVAGATPVVLISAGVGVTPMLAMLHGVAAANARASRPVWWLHSARDRAHHSFAKEADDLLVALRAAASLRHLQSACAGRQARPGLRSTRPSFARSCCTSSGFPKTQISICVVRLASSTISRKAWRHGAFPGPGFTSKCSGPRPLSRRASPASPQPYLIVLTAPRAADPW